jgi:hypothetical protein
VEREVIGSRVSHLEPKIGPSTHLRFYIQEYKRVMNDKEKVNKKKLLGLTGYDS